MKQNKKILIIITCLLLLTGCTKTLKDSNDSAEKDKNGRYLTKINDTDQVINEVYVTVGEGTKIDSMTRKNPDEDSFSIKIPKDYSEYTTFVVTLIDRYDMKYQKKVKNVKATGRTEVKIDETNYVEEKDDFWDKIDKFFNGDS